MPRENPAEYDFEKETGHINEFDAAKDDGDSLDAGVVGELAEVEIGGSGAGSFGAYDRVAFGGIPERHRQNGKAKVKGDLQQDDGAGASIDCPAGTQVRFLLTDHQRNRRIASTEWFDKDLVEHSDPAKRPTLEFEGVDDASWAKNGRTVVIQYRNQRQSTRLDVQHTNLQFPYIGAY